MPDSACCRQKVQVSSTTEGECWIPASGGKWHAKTTHTKRTWPKTHVWPGDDVAPGQGNYGTSLLMSREYRSPHLEGNTRRHPEYYCVHLSFSVPSSSYLEMLAHQRVHPALHRIHVVGRFRPARIVLDESQAPFPPDVAHGPLLRAPTAAIGVTRDGPAAVRVRAAHHVPQKTAIVGNKDRQNRPHGADYLLGSVSSTVPENRSVVS